MALSSTNTILFGVALSFCVIVSLTAPIPKKDLHSSCFDLEDGTHYLQILSNNELSLLSLSEDNYLKAPIVHVRCHDGYAIIDPHFEPEWINYFSTWHEWKVNTAGPDLEDHVSWNEWFLPSQNIKDDDDEGNNDVTYTISPDCKQCIGGDDEDYVDKVYYMSGDIFSCYWPMNDHLLFANHQPQQCVIDSNEYSECSKCHDSNHDKIYYSANCGSMIYDTNTPIFKDHQRCMEHQQPNKLPSIGTNGAYCVCYKPLQSTDIKQANWADHYASDSWDDEDSIFDGEKEKQLKQDQDEQEEAENDQDKVSINLSQKDFNHGTYRIRQPGVYTITEDITFNFNPGGKKHPNARYSWMPNEDQEDEYPGASNENHDDFYSMGFFAGIAVETDNVIIDLNGHSIAMDPLFYTQQRVFSCIALTNKLFADENEDSITFMGIGQKSANNVVIKNGVIGLSSHMGILGIKNRYVHLVDIHVRDFETHGIVFDQFDSITMKNVEIGPSVNGQLKVNKRYSAARLMLPTFYAVAEENDDDDLVDGEETKTVSFSGRGEFSMNEIVGRLVQRMDLAFEYAINGEKNIDIHSDLWRETKELFINQDGVSTHGSIYGLVLRPNKAGGSMNDDANSQVANIEDLYVHDLIINPQQVTKIGVSADLWLRNSFNEPIDLSVAVKKPIEYLEEESEDQDEEEMYAVDADELPNIMDAEYYGDVYTDALFAMRQLSDSWWSLGRTVIWPEFLEWSQNGGALSSYLDEGDDRVQDLKHICGYDPVSGVAKGAIGIHIAESRHIEMSNIEIENLINMASFGNANCDYYGQKYRGNHATAINLYDSDYVHVDELNVQKIVSFSGPAYGIYIDQNDNDNEEGDMNQQQIRDETDEETDDEQVGISLNYVKFSHIDAGIKAKYDGIDMSEDDEFNHAASSCAVYCESDCAKIDFYDLETQCMNGHIHCEQYKQMLIHHECQSNADYVTPIGTLHVTQDGQIDADLIMPAKKSKFTSVLFKGQWFTLGILVLLIVLVAIKCVYFRNSKDKNTRRAQNDAELQESSPLIDDDENRRMHHYSTL